MLHAEIIHIIWLVVAIVLEIVANIFLKQSQGLQRPAYAALAITCVLLAFSALGQAVKGIDLSVAYALWGGMGIIATVTAGWIMFGQKLTYRGWSGIAILVIGVAIIKLS